jgi:hypothetical protein
MKESRFLLFLKMGIIELIRQFQTMIQNTIQESIKISKITFVIE